MRTVTPLFMLCFLSCSSNEQVEPAPTPAPTSQPAPGESGWAPGTALGSPSPAGARGWLDRRGPIHAHSVYSHDACDGEPRQGDELTGPINEPCLADFRAALCTTKHNFVMLTDHSTSFAHAEFPDVVLYDASAGDQLIERDGQPVANRLACPGGGEVIVIAGTESGPMPVGLEGHVEGTPDERKSLYDSTDAASIETMRAQGAVILLQHTEDWSVQQLTDWPIDGFEMFNLHQNLVVGAGGAIELIGDLNKSPETLPHADLALMNIVSEDPAYLERWASVLSAGARRVTTMGTDCHQNTFQQVLPDGERIDGYRRMMSFFSNHLLVRDQQPITDLDLKDALRAGRLYGAFEMLGYPEGFDFHAEVGGAITEMGGEVAVGATLSVALPSVRDLDPVVEPPTITARILRANGAQWDVMAEGTDAITFTTIEPGAYRAEVRMVPRHLLPHVGTYTHLADRDFVWIYANPIYVVP